MIATQSEFFATSDRTHTEPSKILVYGAGVIGSILASRLQRAGRNVTVLARGQRFTDLRKHGIILENQATGERTVAQVPVVERLAPEDDYDLVFVVVRRNQVDAVLPDLAAARKVPSICFMVNTAAGFAAWSEAVGPERVLLGFPGAGGVRTGPLVRYVITPAWMQRTTFGEPDRRISPRLESVLRMFRGAGLPVAACTDMSSWLTSHIALVSPLANGIYIARGDTGVLAKDLDAIRLIVDGIREGFAVVRALGLNVTPRKLRLFDVMPAPLLVSSLRAWIRTRQFETVAKAHAVAAVDEMHFLAHEFHQLAHATGTRTSALDQLRAACDAFKAACAGA